MNKGIIVVDVVKSCDMCKMGFQNEYYDRFECFLEPDKKLENPEECRPDWCPIRPMPEKKGPSRLPLAPILPLDYTNYERGRNDCISEILKGVETDDESRAVGRQLYEEENNMEILHNHLNEAFEKNGEISLARDIIPFLQAYCMGMKLTDNNVAAVRDAVWSEIARITVSHMLVAFPIFKKDVQNASVNITDIVYKKCH